MQTQYRSLSKRKDKLKQVAQMNPLTAAISPNINKLVVTKSLNMNPTIPLCDAPRLSPRERMMCAIGNAEYIINTVVSILPALAKPEASDPIKSIAPMMMAISIDNKTKSEMSW